MSTPSQRPLSFNAAPLSLYRQSLSITRWLGKMASATPGELLLCSRLSFGCGLERRIAPELTGLDPPLRVFTAALLAAFESSQPVLEAQRGKIKPLKAGSDHRMLGIPDMR
ncbi:hypothetical protein NQZ68_002527 [Dissostichus eleginoides]|nr:hypothetical protein NQZ68_002527 [Dissostichus eleginoides]